MKDFLTSMVLYEQDVIYLFEKLDSKIDLIKSNRGTMDRLANVI